MKSLFLLLVGILTSSAFAEINLSRSACGYYVIAAEENFNLNSDRFRVGEVTTVDVGLAKISLLNAQYECRLILVTGYCAEAPKVAKQLVEDIKQEVLTGSRTTDQVLIANKLFAEVITRCN